MKGWSVIERRKKTPLGEIDLICRKGNLIAFVEVKWRNTAAELDHAIDEYRLRRVAAAAEAVAHLYATQGEDIRIDVILLAPGSFPRHIENAWMP
jgi:putative endonuclease